MHSCKALSPCTRFHTYYHFAPLVEFSSPLGDFWRLLPCLGPLLISALRAGLLPMARFLNLFSLCISRPTQYCVRFAHVALGSTQQHLVPPEPVSPCHNPRPLFRISVRVSPPRISDPITANNRSSDVGSHPT